MSQVYLNDQFIDLMETLATIMITQGETFKARAYQKAQETIMSYPTNIVSPNDLKGQPFIGENIMQKLIEYSETGTLQLIEREKNNPVNILTGVYGIGPKKAVALVEQGISSIAQLRANQHLLNDVQKTGLCHYEDILMRIPRSEIEEYKVIFESNFPYKTDADSKMEIVGSYRRGAHNSGDIDVIITSKSHTVFTTFIDNLVRKNIILHILSKGPTKCLVIAKIPSTNTVRRVDFLYTTPDEFPFAILYFTGSKAFNTVMRHIATKKGYTMNEHGIYHIEEKKKRDKVNTYFTSEEDIFRFLGMLYKSPTERIDGRAVMLKKPAFIIEEDDDEAEEVEDKEVEDKEVEVKDNVYISIAKDFKKNGIVVLQTLSETNLIDLLREANKSYYNEDPFLTDSQYDIIKDFIETTYPSNEVIHEIGSVVERNKATLPYPMGSMDKIKPDTSALSKWTAKYNNVYILSCKLDGVSGLYTTEGSIPKLYTRGDGRIGQDISHLIPFLRLPTTKGLVIRGEFVISKVVFKEKYKGEFSNPRNMVAGIINNKTINETIKDVNFVAYELIKPTKLPSEQLSYLLTQNIETVLYTIHPNISNELLSTTLVDWRHIYKYEIDGVIVTNNSKYEIKYGNPEHAFAFKMVLSDQYAEAKVVDVIWGASKDGYLKPRVQIEPIYLGGVKITYATGFNGSFINNNKIGIGATIEIIRSGDVIPYINKVIVQAEEPKMPSVAFKWNDTHIDVVLEDIESNETVREKNIAKFFKGIGVEGLSDGNIKRIIDKGYDTVPLILQMEITDFLLVDGFKTTLATKLYNGIKEKIQVASLVTIMSSSNIFGRGFSEKKIELIVDAYPNVLANEPDSVKSKRIAKIKGMAEKTAEAFVERISHFIQFMKEAGLHQTIVEKKETVKSHPLFGKSIAMTGFRDNALQDKCKEIGVKISSSVSSKTFAVLVKDINETSVKISEAKKAGIQIMTAKEFTDKYIL